jgi:protein required for attachment to host cells
MAIQQSESIDLNHSKMANPQPEASKATQRKNKHIDLCLRPKRVIKPSTEDRVPKKDKIYGGNTLIQPFLSFTVIAPPKTVERMRRDLKQRQRRMSICKSFTESKCFGVKEYNRKIIFFR